MSLPVVAIVGRPNVGKSTLVNRIVGRREAIVQEQPGVTRDRKELEADWRDRRFVLVDTGGWMAPNAGSGLDLQVSRQAERAIKGADVVLFVVDAIVGVTEEDAQVAGVLRRAKRPVVVVVNKVDSEHREADAWDFTRLGLGDVVAVSALHGRQVGDLLGDVGPGFGVEQIQLVEHDEDRAAGHVDALGQALVLVGHPLGGVDHEEGGVGPVDGLQRPHQRVVLRALVDAALATHARGVDEADRPIGRLHHGVDRVAGGTRMVVDDGPVVADQPDAKRRFGHLG